MTLRRLRRGTASCVIPRTDHGTCEFGTNAAERVGLATPYPDPGTRSQEFGRCDLRARCERAAALRTIRWSSPTPDRSSRGLLVRIPENAPWAGAAIAFRSLFRRAAVVRIVNRSPRFVRSGCDPSTRVFASPPNVRDPTFAKPRRWEKVRLCRPDRGRGHDVHGSDRRRSTTLRTPSVPDPRHP